MSSAEAALFRAFVTDSRRYLEFGCGGSTVLASGQAKDWIVSVDSSREWLDQVETRCAGAVTRPELVFVDIGAVGDWGYPIDAAARPRWSQYHAAVYERSPKYRDADFIMLDGRFRIAGFAQAILRCADTALIGFHDFASRPHYHVVHQLGREIATAEDMSVFLPRPGAREKAAKILEAFWDDPS
jgi:hypothetical protein